MLIDLVVALSRDPNAQAEWRTADKARQKQLLALHGVDPALLDKSDYPPFRDLEARLHRQLAIVVAEAHLAISDSASPWPVTGLEIMTSAPGTGPVDAPIDFVVTGYNLGDVTELTFRRISTAPSPIVVVAPAVASTDGRRLTCTATFAVPGTYSVETPPIENDPYPEFRLLRDAFVATAASGT
jgi:hypothetical protein